MNFTTFSISVLESLIDCYEVAAKIFRFFQTVCRVVYAIGQIAGVEYFQKGGREWIAAEIQPVRDVAVKVWQTTKVVAPVAAQIASEIVLMAFEALVILVIFMTGEFANWIAATTVAYFCGDQPALTPVELPREFWTEAA